MLKQDQNQGGQRRRTCATDQMLRKTLLLPVSAPAPRSERLVTIA